MANCNRCNVPLDEGESYNFHGETLCEDCYMNLTNPPKACDPLAVASALSVRKQLGQSGDEGLTEQQKKIYHQIQKTGRITRHELEAALNLKPAVLEAEFAVLRHCELIRAHREENGAVYLTLW
ncbi:MAG: hypothetical protein NWF05_05260 [Candidatus Bathyarchaeota archaeon]|nr:hypothetical protein [Candidatus Bathyarchaeota archaeon]